MKNVVFRISTKWDIKLWKRRNHYSVREIAAELDISQPRVYQPIAKAKAIGKEYRKING